MEGCQYPRHVSGHPWSPRDVCSDSSPEALQEEAKEAETNCEPTKAEVKKALDLERHGNSKIWKVDWYTKYITLYDNMCIYIYIYILPSTLLVAIFHDYCHCFGCHGSFRRGGRKAGCSESFQAQTPGRPNRSNIASVVLNAHPLVRTWKQGYRQFWTLFLSRSQLCIYRTSVREPRQRKVLQPQIS